MVSIVYVESCGPFFVLSSFSFLETLHCLSFSIKEEQTTQWPKEKVEKNKQRSRKHTHKTKDRVTEPH